MNIYEFAMKMEKDQEAYYRNLRKKVGQPGLQRILDMLANEEAKHYKIVEQLSRNVENPRMAETTILENAKTIFAQMKDEKPDLSGIIPEADLYRKAQTLEKKSHKFYLRKADETEGEPQKHLFLRLAEEEKKHMLLIENLVAFITRPQTWLEDAEWYHLDEY